MIELIPAALDGERIDRVVSLITGCSRSEATALIGDGQVIVDGRPARKASQKITEGQEVSVSYTPEVIDHTARPNAEVSANVVYADNHVLIVDKPAGLVVHPGNGHENDTLVNGLLVDYPELAGVGEPERPGIVHRLDRGTSGVLMVARTEEARLDLVRQLAARTAGREYLCVAWGHPETDQGIVDAPLGRSKRHPTRMAVVVDGREARTRYQVEHRYFEPASVSVLSCRLETGRTHQIRVHLSAIGHPVVGDEWYGGIRDSLEFPRPALHAQRLTFQHPGSGDTVSFESPVPDDMAELIDRLA